MMTLLLFRPMEILPNHCEEFAVVRREELPQNGNHLIRYLLLEQKKEINHYLFDLKKIYIYIKRRKKDVGSLDWISRSK